MSVRKIRWIKRAPTETAARLAKNADVIKATATRDKMANVPSSTSAIRPTAIPARCARSSTFAKAGILTDALSARNEHCYAILGGNAMGSLTCERVARPRGTRAGWAQWDLTNFY